MLDYFEHATTFVSSRQIILFMQLSGLLVKMKMFVAVNGLTYTWLTFAVIMLYILSTQFELLNHSACSPSNLGPKEEVQEPENPNQVVYQTAHTKSIIIYKEGFVPYTTRIYNFIKSFSSEPGSGDSNK